MHRHLLTATLLLLSLGQLGCSTMAENFHKGDEAQRQMNYVRQTCEPGAGPGPVAGLHALLALRQQALAQATLPPERRLGLSQALAGHAAKLELVAARYTEACRIRALCVYRQRTDGECSGAVEDHAARARDLDALSGALERLALSTRD